jgi:UDP-N-acetylmuramoyl-L-alanyl-D-glutamate--2,6-diaminopimelate ligase
MRKALRKAVPDRSPLRKSYHKIMAMVAAVTRGFPANQLRVIAVTGTSGKSTTCELIHYLLQQSGIPTGMIATTQIRIGDQVIPNPTLRTTLRPSLTQKYLKQMVKNGIRYVVIEVSSHALDQNRLWGINIDTAVITNIFDNEHLDYHGTLDDYIKTKASLFKSINTFTRKTNVPKMAILNRDDAHFAEFNQHPADKKWTFARKGPGDIRAENIVYQEGKIEFTLRLPNEKIQLEAPLMGVHNLENVLTAITVAISHGVDPKTVQSILKEFPGAPGRLEYIDLGQEFSVVVDFTYKPSALQSVLGMLKKLIKGKLIVVWGPAGGRSQENLQESTSIIHQHTDQFILTTDDPGDTNPKLLAQICRQALPRREGEGFFEIEDRYEAIRYAVLTAQPGDLVLIAGRGSESIQKIGTKEIHFDDREIAREILGHVITKATPKQE